MSDERCLDPLEEEALRLVRENRVEEVSGKAKLKVTLGREAANSLIDLIMRPYNWRLVASFPSLPKLDGVDEDVLKMLVDADFTNKESERLSFEVEYANVERIGALVFAELLGDRSRGQMAHPMERLMSPKYGTDLHGSAFLDLNEAFTLAGGADVRHFRLGVQKLMETS